MPVQTLARPHHASRKFSPVAARPVRIAIPQRSPRREAKAEKIAPAKLEEVEERLLADVLERHANAEAALDGALDDMTVLSAELSRSRRRPLLLRSTTNLNRVEDLLLEAILRTHPNAEHALDRLLDDVNADDAPVEAVAAHAANVDNDFDGMS